MENAIMLKGNPGRPVVSKGSHADAILFRERSPGEAELCNTARLF